MTNIFCVGSVNVDFFHLPTRTQKYLGGSAANTAYFLTNLLPKNDFITYLVSLVGSDQDGDWALVKLAERGLSSQYVYQISGKTGSTQITLDSNAERTIKRSKSVTSQLSELLMSKKIQTDIIKGLIHVKAGQDVIRGLLSIIPTIFSTDFSGFIGDPNDAAEEKQILFQNWLDSLPPDRSFEILLGNEEEYAAFLFLMGFIKKGENFLALTENERHNLIRRLLSSWRTKIAVIKKGKDGAELITQEHAYRASALKITPIDTTGAGDAFNAAFIAKYLQNADLQTALKFACTIGSINCQTFGGQETPPDKLKQSEERIPN